jgi:hypothetical protein
MFAVDYEYLWCLVGLLDKYFVRKCLRFYIECGNVMDTGDED